MKWSVFSSPYQCLGQFPPKSIWTLVFNSPPNGDRRSFKANLRPIADVAPPHLRRFTTDLRPRCNIYRRYSTVGSAPIGSESAVTFALNRPRFGLGRTSSGHKKMRTAHDWCRRLALIHQPVRFTLRSQKTLILHSHVQMFCRNYLNF